MARFALTMRVPPAVVRELSDRTTAPVYGSTNTRVRPPGVRSSGNRIATRYADFGFGGPTAIGTAPGIALRAASTAASGVTSAAPARGATGTANGYGCESVTR